MKYKLRENWHFFIISKNDIMALELAPSYNNFGATSFDWPFLVIALVFMQVGHSNQ